MNRCVCLGTFIIAGGVLVGTSEARLPRTLNFTNITATNVHQNPALPEVGGNEKHVDAGDFDNDGDLDIVVGVGFSDFGARRSKLYRNDAGQFNEITGNPAIPGMLTAQTTRNAFFRDLDNDGWLDIFVVNDSNQGNGDRRERLYMNKHPGDVFSNFVDETLVPLRFPPNGQSGPECSSVCVDINGDGLVDFYAANYPNASQDRMWFNDLANPGFFIEQGVGTMVPGDGDYTVDASTADLNGDGKVDIILSNWPSSGGAKVYYNNALNQGSSAGDLLYNNSVQNLGSPGQSENAMEPGDFDNDGRIDIYASDGGTGFTDKIYRNTATAANGQATFTSITTMPPYVSANVSVKATVNDFNKDGRVDIFVMMQNGRPAMLRNTTVNGQISFVDWTPGNTFPSTGTTFNGWQAAYVDFDADGWEDLFVGAMSNDHLFRNAASNEVNEAAIGGILPPIFSAPPVAVSGSVGATADVYVSMGGIPGNMIISSVLTSASDLRLEVLNGSDAVIASSNRGGIGVEEALQAVTQASGTKLRVSLIRAAGDQNNDGDLDVSDFDAMNDCGVHPGQHLTAGCEIFDFNLDGSIDMADVQQFQLYNSGNGVPASGGYVLEALSRTAN